MYLVKENEKRKLKTEQNRSVAKTFVIFMAPYFIVFLAPPQRAPQCELVFPPFTLAPPGELVFIFFVFFLGRGRFCPFSLKLSFSLCDHSRTTKRDQKPVVSRSKIVVSPSRVVVVVVFEVAVVVVSVAGSLCSLLK